MVDPFYSFLLAAQAGRGTDEKGATVIFFNDCGFP